MKFAKPEDADLLAAAQKSPSDQVEEDDGTVTFAWAPEEEEDLLLPAAVEANADHLAAIKETLEEVHCSTRAAFSDWKLLIVLGTDRRRVSNRDDDGWISLSSRKNSPHCFTRWDCHIFHRTLAHSLEVPCQVLVSAWYEGCLLNNLSKLRPSYLSTP